MDDQELYYMLWSLMQIIDEYKETLTPTQQEAVNKADNWLENH